MAALVAMASMETSAPLSPSSAPRRSSSTGIAAVSLPCHGTASWPSTRRAVVAKAETRCSGALPVLRSWLRREVLPSMATKSGLLGPCLAHPGGEGGREQRRDRCGSSGWSASVRRARRDGRADSGAGSRDAPRPSRQYDRSRRNRRWCRRPPAAGPPAADAPPATARAGLRWCEKCSSSAFRRGFSNPSRAAMVMAGLRIIEAPWNQISRNPQSALTRVRSPAI